MSLRTKSIEELLDLEEELRSSLDEEDGSYYKIIQVYEELLRKIRADRSGKYELSLPMIKKRLILCLVHYGTYLKTQNQKNDRAAEDSLKKAIHYDRENPIVHYRLGFLSYKQHSYASAIEYFQKATKFQEFYSHPEYKLSKQQMYNTQLYLSNSALYIAQESQKILEDLEDEENLKNAPQLPISALFERIQSNEKYLVENAFTIVTPDGKSRCSKQKCEAIAEKGSPDTLILYFSDRDESIIFNGREIHISKDQSEILRYFLLETTEQAPALKNDFSKIIQSDSKSGEILTNTYTQIVRRLRGKIEQVGVPISIIDNKEYQGQTAYYYNQKIPFQIMHRTDATFILD